uniref:Peroxisomal 2-hydroxy acid oxidase n=1 Tax=Gambierdiscus polynesiensis TaxID=439318 RepID=A0A6M5KEI3_9DINO|nr:peroxisomal 2-hydroxy acid oxidase [Gambierdiscus polynesiensis]
MELPTGEVVCNLRDFEAIAKKKMDAVDYDYYAAGGEDELTLQRNKETWQHIVIWPRFLVDCSHIEMNTQLRSLGLDLSMPVLVPPMAMQKLAHPDGEVALARAAHAAGLPYCFTQQATTKFETVCEQAPGPKLFQMYIFEDRALSEGLLRRAEACGVKAIVITVDSPVLGRRERDLRNKFTPASRGVALVNYVARTSNGSQDAVKARTSGRDAGFSWSDLAWAKQATRLPIILKGIVHPADAALAVEHGVAAVWVSNHGGRQLDGGPATAVALPLVASAVRGRVPLIVDGGVARGADVLRALALGASAACVGRPLLWALAAGGEQGAGLALAMLREELRTAMALSGVVSVHKVARGLVQLPGEPSLHSSL